MRVVFAGTPDFSVPALNALVDAGHDVIAVYTQPDRPAGRGQKVRESPVKRRANELQIPVRQPASLRSDQEAQMLRDANADVMIVVAYGLLLPPAILQIPRLGCINIHASLLPRWRGAAPIQRAIMAGDTQTGISIMQMNEGLDTGPVLLQSKTDIEADDTAGSLHDRLAIMGGDAIVATLDRFAAENNCPDAIPQENADASYADKLSKSEALIDWHRPAMEISRKVRGMNPWPIAETRWDGQQLRIWQASIGPRIDADASAPGSVLRSDRDGIVVACGAGTLVLTKVQLAGRKTVAVAEFVKAHDLAGSCLNGSTETSAE